MTLDEQHLQDLLLWALLIGRHWRVPIGWIPLQHHAPLPQAVAQLPSVLRADRPALQRQASQRRKSRQNAEQRRQPRRAGSRGQRSQTEIHVLQRAQASCCQQGGPAFITHGAVVGQVQHPQRGQTSTPAHSSCTGQRWRTDQ